jgi:hypothetical protein
MIVRTALDVQARVHARGIGCRGVCAHRLAQLDGRALEVAELESGDRCEVARTGIAGQPRSSLSAAMLRASRARAESDRGSDSRGSVPRDRSLGFASWSSPTSTSRSARANSSSIEDAFRAHSLDPRERARCRWRR